MAAEAADPSRSGADGAAGAGGVIGGGGGGEGGGAGCAALLCSRSCIGAAGTNAGRCVVPHPPPPPPPPAAVLQGWLRGGRGDPQRSSVGLDPPPQLKQGHCVSLHFHSLSVCWEGGCRGGLLYVCVHICQSIPVPLHRTHPLLPQNTPPDGGMGSGSSPALGCRGGARRMLHRMEDCEPCRAPHPLRGIPGL